VLPHLDARLQNQDTTSAKGCAGFINLVSSPTFAFQINHAADTIVAAGQLL
jgi:competence protein ComGC